MDFSRLSHGTTQALEINMPNEPTAAEVTAAFRLATIAVETIRDAGPDGIPSGRLYAAMMSVFSSLETYESMIALLIRSELITRAPNHVLRCTVKVPPATL